MMERPVFSVGSSCEITVVVSGWIMVTIVKVTD